MSLNDETENKRDFKVFHYFINASIVNSTEYGIISRQVSSLPFIDIVTVAKLNGDDLTEQEKDSS